MTDTPYRLSVELPNGAKFRAHGDAAEVRVDLEKFYGLLLGVPNPTMVPANGTGTVHEHTNGTGPAESGEPFTPPSSESLDQTTLNRLFAKDSYGTVSLRALPRGDNAEADALVALIYGASRLSNEQQVTGSRLMKAATQSGLHQVDRIDRTLSSQIGPYVTTAGFKKGRRYGLTNPGIRRAEEILTGILG